MARTGATTRPGTMRERPPGSGNWQLRAFTGTDPLTGKPRQEARTFHGSEKQAAKELATLVAEAAKGRVAKTDATVGQLLDRWLEVSATRQRPRTLYENRSKIENRIRPVLGKIKLSRLGADTLDTLYGQWLTGVDPLTGKKVRPLSPSTVRALHAILSSSCRQAVKWGWIDEAPTDRASPPQQLEKEMVVPTPTQLAQLLDAADAAGPDARRGGGEDPVLATAIALAALTGCRRGELCALRWSDVDLELGRVRIARSLTVAGGTRHEGPTKTRATRWVTLDELGVEVLRRRWAFMEDLSAEAESPLAVDPYVLSYNANGALPATPDVFTHRFWALCRAMERATAKKRRVKVEALRPDELWPFRFHDLRHFSVTTLIAAGVDVRTVAARHGHAQPTMTLNRYAHALPERDRAAAGVLGRALSPMADHR